MEIRQLEILSRVAETGSFSRAAKAMGLSQPTASEHIKTLEKELGTRLFDRLGRRVEPTKAGLLLLEYARKILQARDDARLAMEDYLGVISGHILIGASTIPGGYLLPRLLGQFKVMHPETSVTIDIIDSRKVVEGVLGGSVQLGITGAKISNSQLVYQFFATDELVLAVPPDHPLARRKKIQAKALQGVKMIVREDGSGTRLVSEARLRELGFEIGPDQVAAVLGNSQAVRSALKGGVGVSIISRMAVEEDFECGALCPVEIRGFACTRDFYSVVHKARSLSPLGRTFLEFIHGADVS
jgi:DNA-binding transcriptional LysR family regulator